MSGYTQGYSDRGINATDWYGSLIGNHINYADVSVGPFPQGSIPTYNEWKSRFTVGSKTINPETPAKGFQIMIEENYIDPDNLVDWTNSGL